MRAWVDFIASQQGRLGQETVDQWLLPFKVIHFDACNLYLEAPSPLHLLWFEEHMRPVVLKEFVNNNHHLIRIHVTASGTATSSPQKKSPKKESILPPAPRFSSDSLDPAFSFSNFVPDKNSVALKLFSEVAISYPPSLYNPIYLYGPSGSGKSHLLTAVAHTLTERGLSSLFVKSETFTEHLIQAIRSGTMQLFRKTYRNYDLLLLDDVHLFSRKNATQEEFFHTFNALHGMSKQIIITGNTPPGQLLEIEPRLISRFEWGIAVSLQLPSKEALYKIALQKSEAFGLKLKEDVLAYLVEQFGKQPKSLHLALNAVTLRLHLLKKKGIDLTLPLLEELLADLIEKEKKELLSPEKIIEQVALLLSVTEGTILGKSQKQEDVLPRQLAMYLCREKLNLPCQKIGAIFKRDHSTVMASIKKIEDRKEENTIAEILHSLSKIT